MLFSFQSLQKIGDLPAPSVNQIEINPFLYRKDTIDFCEKQGTHMQAYRGLTNGKNREHPTITRIAQKLNRTNVQILGRWLIQHGFSHLPKSQNADRYNLYKLLNKLKIETSLFFWVVGKF